MTPPLDAALERSQPFRPWSADDLIRLVTANLGALLMIGVGCSQGSRGSSTSGALGWLNLAFAGVILAGAANGLWVFRGRRALTIARAVVLAPLEGPEGLGSSARVAAGPGDGAAVVMVPDSQRFHRPACALVGGRAVRSAEPGARALGGRVPCEVCRP